MSGVGTLCANAHYRASLYLLPQIEYFISCNKKFMTKFEDYINRVKFISFISGSVLLLIIKVRKIEHLGNADPSSWTSPNMLSAGSATLLLVFLAPDAGPSSPADAFLLLLVFSLLPPRVPVLEDFESFSRLLSFSFLP